MSINYHGKTFRAVKNTHNGETSPDTLFHYRQQGNIIQADYAGGKIICGQLLGTVDETGRITLRYQQINSLGELMTGVCTSTPEMMANGKIRLHEQWKWTSGDGSAGESIIEEV